MIEVNWSDHDTLDALADAVAAQVAAVVAEGRAARGASLVAFPGGATPKPVFARLAAARPDWSRVMIVPTDERIVPMTSPLSNAAELGRTFASFGATVVPMVDGDAKDRHAAGDAADVRLSRLDWPADLVWLGAGGDGHTASIFPGADYAAALDARAGRFAVGVRPDPLPPEAPVDRVTLTRSAIASARRVLLTITGDPKRAVVEQALAEGDASRFPIGRVLAYCRGAIDVHWCPA